MPIYRQWRYDVEFTYITRLHIPTRQDFLNNLVLVRRAELVLKLLSARRIQYALLAVSVDLIVSTCFSERGV